MKQSTYDILVIGAGPGGSVVSRDLAKLGYSVLMIEKRPVIGSPVRCGEASSGRAALELDYGPIHDDCIETDIQGALLHATGGISIRAELPGVSTMLDRLKFDPWLAHLAEQDGAEIVVDARATDVRPLHNGFREVPIIWNDNEHLIKAKMVIGADGVEALTGRWTGLKTRQLPPHTCSAIELKLDVLDPNPDLLTFWHGYDSLNDGYVWSFPKKKSGTTNFGAGFITPKLNTPNIREVAEQWKERMFPQANILSVMGGAVPVSGNLEEVVSDHFLLVGDAAHHTNPLTGGGIAAAMRAGQIAAKVVHQGLQSNDLSKTFLQRYQAATWERFGKSHAKQMRIRQFILTMDRQRQIDFYTVFKTWVENGRALGVLRQHPFLAASLAMDYWKFDRAARKKMPTKAG